MTTKLCSATGSFGKERLEDFSLIGRCTFVIVVLGPIAGGSESRNSFNRGLKRKNTVRKKAVLFTYRLISILCAAAGDLLFSSSFVATLWYLFISFIALFLQPSLLVSSASSRALYEKHRRGTSACFMLIGMTSSLRWLLSSVLASLLSLFFRSSSDVSIMSVEFEFLLADVAFGSFGCFSYGESIEYFPMKSPPRPLLASPTFGDKTPYFRRN